jgi:acyl carrier protein phosphodiesterase
MNFLAHAYLSFGEKEILVGNMISDFVKGKAQYDFIPGIRKGIILHRMIDEFTDTHLSVKQAKEIFRKDYRLYSSPIVDILFDHFLANDSTQFTPGVFSKFTQTVYQTLEEYATHLPLRFVTVFSYMKAEDWLLNYQYRQGIEKSVRGLVRRASFLEDSTTAIALFNEHYSSLEERYHQFFKDVKIYAKQQLALLKNK